MKRFRPLLISAALGVAALALTRLNDRIRAAPPAVSGAFGAVLYASAFDEDGDEWETYEGRLSSRIDGGVLKIDVGAENSAPFVPTRWHFGDFDLRVLAGSSGGPIENGYGVVFRMRDPGNFYSFLITSDGYYRLGKTVDGTESEVSTYIPSDAINPDHGVYNAIRVVGVGDTFTFFVNGERVSMCLPDNPEGSSTFSGGQCFGTMVESWSDGAHASGRVGLIAASGLEPDVSVQFDNLVVVQP